MCGIAGCTWADEALVSAMAASLAHRGPDGQGCYVGDGIALGHRRLRIIDLSDQANQPMGNEDGSVWLVFNGEIYNYQDLRATLEGAGHVFRSRSDSEVIVHAYEQYGTGCLERLRGMFAFGIWDGRRRRLLLARDRLGIKPLYYAQVDRGLLFASEIKALLQCDRLARRVDPQAVYHFLGYEFVPEPGTMLEGVVALPPGQWLEWHEGDVRRGTYWDLRMAAVERSQAGHEAVLRDAVQDAVQSHLVSDVPIGVFLSGGLDSSTVVAAMRHAGVAHIRTFSLGYADRSYSELDYARLVSRAFDTDHQELIIEPVTPDTVQDTVWHAEGPMSDLSAVPFYLLCREVRRHVTVCLSGEGGDEALVGYDRFKASRANRIYARLPAWLRQQVIPPLTRQLGDRPQKKGAVNILKRFVEGGLLPGDGEHLRWQYFSSRQMEDELFGPAFRSQVRLDPFEPVRRQIAGRTFDTALDREIFLETRFAMVGNPLFKVDRMSMAHGLEVRVPLVDHQFVEACASIPGSHKLRGFTTKAVLRRAMRGVLPEPILRRGKQGYSLPVKHWLRRELYAFTRDTIDGSPLIRDLLDRRAIHRLLDEHRDLRANHSHVLWALLHLAIWHQLFVRRRLPAARAMERRGIHSDSTRQMYRAGRL